MTLSVRQRFLGLEHSCSVLRPNSASREGIRLVVGGGLAKKPDGPMVALLRDAHATRDVDAKRFWFLVGVS